DIIKFIFFFSSRRRHTRFSRDWSSDVCSSDLMPTLLDRKDRMSMGASIEARVPFGDHQLVEYVWNIPWEIKTYNNREKGILRKEIGRASCREGEQVAEAGVAVREGYGNGQENR